MHTENWQFPLIGLGDTLTGLALPMEARFSLLPRLLTPHQKEQRQQCSQQLLDLFNQDQAKFLTV